jgi:lysylphosphatidylglycerol synthetase-like protein (DUF2156 family)
VSPPTGGWASPLGASTILFLLSGLVYLVIGALAPLLHDRGIGPTMLFISPRADTVLFGAAPTDLLNDPALSRLRSLLITALGGILVAAGILVIATAVFALRDGERWALVSLALAGVAVLPFWVLVFRPYVAAGAALSLADLPPFMWVPAALLIPASVLGWIGTR